MTGYTILAIDLGKYKCVACVYDQVTAAAEFRTFTTSRAEAERRIRAARPAVVALARKVLVRCWVMLRDNRTWRPDPDPAVATAA